MSALDIYVEARTKLLSECCLYGKTIQRAGKLQRIDSDYYVYGDSS